MNDGDEKAVCITVKVDVPETVTNAGLECTIAWLRNYFNCLAESNDGSEFLANLPLSEGTVEITEEFS
jgi:hypothetical protein